MDTNSFFAIAAMISWPVIAGCLFLFVKPRSAILIGLLGGWLLLPQTGFRLSGLPDYDRTAATILGVALGIMLFDLPRLLSFRIRWYDLALVIFIISGFCSSISNGLGPYDGISVSVSTVITYAIPYFLGRVYFNDAEGMRNLAVGLLVAVICYAPLIFYELKQSPHLHRSVYGFSQTPFHMVWRLGWYRPMVFLKHGLELGILLSSAAIVAVWLWRTRSSPRFPRIQPWGLALGFTLLLFLCRALNGYGTFFISIVVLYTTVLMRSRWLVFLCAILPVAYVSGRVVSNWDAMPLVTLVESIDEKRAQSLKSRIAHEITLMDKARERPLFGWGGWNRNRAEVLAEGAMGKESITDSLWIIIFGQRGLVGLISLGAVLTVPVILLIMRLPTQDWVSPTHAPAVALSMALLSFTLDCLFNAMYSPIYLLISGGLMSYLPDSLENQGDS